MAQVYLPFGYPEQSGTEFETLIYQGTVVRLYTLPADPRTDEQLFERKIFGDMTRARGYLGTWVKGALAGALGSRWTGNSSQLIKADVDGFYSDAVENWEGFLNAEKDDWRDVAPYEATFNDPGQVFYVLAYCYVKYLYKFAGDYFTGAEWGASDYDAALTWWNKDRNDALTKGAVEETDSKINYAGSKTTVMDAGANGGQYYKIYQGATNKVSYYTYGNGFGQRWVKDPTHGEVSVYMNGELQQTYDLYNVSRQFNQSGSFGFPNKGLYKIEIIGDSQYFGVDQFRVS